MNEIEKAIAEANATLAAINYDANWSNEQLREAVAGLSAHEVDQIRTALRLLAAAALEEADQLEACLPG